MEIDPSVVASYLEAKGVIIRFIRELRPDLNAADTDHNAAALIARLANNDPPLMICTEDEIKEFSDEGEAKDSAGM